MTGFSLPSQQFAADVRWRAQRRADEAGPMAMDMAKGLQDLMRQKQQKDIELSMFEINRAIAQRKLQEMQAVDMVEAGRLQNEGMRAQIAQQRAQTEAIEYQTKQLRDRESSLSPFERRIERYARYLPKPGTIEAARAGLHIDESGRLDLYERDSEEYQSNLARTEESVVKTRALADRSANMFGTLRASLTEQLEALRQAEQAMRISDPDFAAKRKAIDDERERIKQQLMDLQRAIWERLGEPPPEGEGEASAGIDIEAALEKLDAEIKAARPK